MNAKPVIAITGASRRLGLFLCEHFLERGYAIAAITRKASEALEILAANEEDINVFQLDSIDFAEQLQNNPAQIDSADIECQKVDLVITSLCDTYSCLSGVIHNASKFDKDSIDFSMRDYLDFFRIHMAMPAQLNEGLYQLLYNENQPGNIIHITDIFSENPNPKFALYCSTKAALENLSKSYAKKFAPGIRVNTVQPGPIQFLESHTEEVKRKVLEETLLQFEGGFMPVFQAVCSIIDNPYITGSAIKVDGGRALGRG